MKKSLDEVLQTRPCLEALRHAGLCRLLAARNATSWCSAQHRVMLSLQLRAFLSSPPPALAGVSFAAQSAQCSPASRTPRRPTAPPLPTGPPSSPSPLLSQRSARASTNQSTPGPRPRNRSLSGANRSPGRRRPVGRDPLSPHPRPLAVTSHLTSSPPPTMVFMCLCNSASENSVFCILRL